MIFQALHPPNHHPHHPIPSYSYSHTLSTTSFNSLPIKFASDPFDRVPSGQTLTSGVYELLVNGSVGPDHQDHPTRRSCSGVRTGMTGGTGGSGGSSASQSASQSAVSSMDQSGGGSGSSQQRQQQQQPRPQRQLGDSVLDTCIFSTSGLQLQSMHVQGVGCEPPLTTRTSSFDGVLDYLFLSAGHFEVQETLEMPYPQQQRQQQRQKQQQQGRDGGGGGGSGGSSPSGRRGRGGSPQPAAAVAQAPGSVSGSQFPPAPNAVYPSDHLAVGAKLKLLK